MTLFEMVRPVRVHRASWFDAGMELVSAEELDARQRYVQYRSAMPGIGLVWPAELLQSPATSRWVRKHGFAVAARSSDELAQAVSVGIQPAQMVMYGDGSNWRPIRCGLNAGVRQFVVNSRDQVAIIENCARRRQQLMVDVNGHDSDEVMAAVCASSRLEFIGLHCELEAPLTAPHRYATAINAMVATVADVRRRSGILATRLSVSGSVGRTPRAVAAVIAEAVEESCAQWHFPRPGLTLTPALR